MAAREEEYERDDISRSLQAHFAFLKLRTTCQQWLNKLGKGESQDKNDSIVEFCRELIAAFLDRYGDESFSLCSENFLKETITYKSYLTNFSIDHLIQHYLLTFPHLKIPHLVGSGLVTWLPAAEQRVHMKALISMPNALRIVMESASTGIKQYFCFHKTQEITMPTLMTAWQLANKGEEREHVKLCINGREVNDDEKLDMDCVVSFEVAAVDQNFAATDPTIQVVPIDDYTTEEVRCLIDTGEEKDLALQSSNPYLAGAVSSPVGSSDDDSQAAAIAHNQALN